MARIVITGVGGPAGKNVAQLLRERGHTVIGTDMCDVSLSGIKFFPVPPANAPDFVDRLYCITMEQAAELLIPTVTEELPIVAAARERWKNIPVVISSYQAVSTANDKYLTCCYLSSQGMSVPRYVLPSEIKSCSDVSKKVGWPCLSKPRVGRGGRGVTVYFEQDWPLIANLDDSYILQEFASGTDYCPNLYLNKQGDVIVEVMEKTVLKEGIVGNALEVKRNSAPDIASLAVAAAKSLNFHGPVDVDIRRLANGRPVVLEINARFGANVANVPEIIDAMLADNGLV